MWRNCCGSKRTWLWCVIPPLPTKVKWEKLEKVGIPYVVVDYTTIEELQNAIDVMGKVFNKEEQAQKYIQFQKDTIEMVNGKLKDVAEENWPSVYHSVNEAIRTDGEGDICGEIMNLAAVKNISIERAYRPAETRPIPPWKKSTNGIPLRSSPTNPR